MTDPKRELEPDKAEEVAEDSSDSAALPQPHEPGDENAQPT